MPSVLISGASIAGPALADRLNGYGWSTTVVERVAGLRAEGHNVDVRGAGREVLRRMGIEDAVLAEHTGETGTEFVDDAGRTIASFPAGEGDTGGATAEVEILRGRLSQILYDRTRDDTEYVFGDQITALDQDDDGVTVAFAHGPARRFDVVVLAEGLRSRTRSLLFGPDPIRELGLYIALVTLPRAAQDTDRWVSLQAGRGRGVGVRPDNVGTTRAMLSFLSDVRGLNELGRADQVAILRATFADVGWEAPRILDALDDAPFYFEGVGQTVLPSWSNGRVALLGDAAYCPSPISGMGTTLALTGAYVLAGELATHAGPRSALARYEAVMRPYVDRAQHLPPGAPRIGSPRGDVERSVMRTVLRLAAGPARGLLGVMGRRFGPPADALELPDYPAAVRSAG